MSRQMFIVANKQQERDVLRNISRRYSVPLDKLKKWSDKEFVGFPRAFDVGEEGISFTSMSMVGIFKDQNIVYDGRNDTRKIYKVPQALMNDLIKWRDLNNLDAQQGDFYNTFMQEDFSNIPYSVYSWRFQGGDSVENNERLIAIIQWFNGEDVFEVTEI